MILYQARQNTLSTASKRYKTGWKGPTRHKEKPNKTQKRHTILAHSYRNSPAHAKETEQPAREAAHTPPDPH